MTTLTDVRQAEMAAATWRQIAELISYLLVSYLWIVLILVGVGLIVALFYSLGVAYTRLLPGQGFDTAATRAASMVTGGIGTATSEFVGFEHAPPIQRTLRMLLPLAVLLFFVMSYSEFLYLHAQRLSAGYVPSWILPAFATFVKLYGSTVWLWRAVWVISTLFLAVLSLRLVCGSRSMAIAGVTFREAIRKRVLYVFVLFLAPFLFAGWWLPKHEEGQLLFLVTFTNTAMTYLTVPLVVFLVSMSLPGDIQTKTIQTIMTKPINRLEFLIGRVAGFVSIFTVVLVAMGLVSLAYVYGNISKDVYLDQWRARVPVYAQEFFFVKDNQVQEKGTHTGAEWDYRSHVKGASSDYVWWTFDFDPRTFGVEPAEMVGDVELKPEGEQKYAVLQLSFDIFKTTKGDPYRKGAEGSGVFCWLTIEDAKAVLVDQDKNPIIDPITSRPRFKQLTRFLFRVEHHRLITISKRIPIEYMRSGGLRITAHTQNHDQYLGMAKHDLYFLAEERSYTVNFLKGLLSLWLQMVFLTTVCVVATTFLKGFVTVLLAVTVLVIGLNYAFINGLVTKQIPGGGPAESLIRLVTGFNSVSDLEDTLPTRIAKQVIDPPLLALMDAASRVVPNLSSLYTVELVAKGFDVPLATILVNSLIVLGYVIPALFAGYFLLRARELA